MTTVITGTLRRSLNYSSFADLTDARLLTWTKTSLTFEGDLDDETVDAIRARMESTDDADQAKRANLLALCEALKNDPDAPEPVKAAVCGVIGYVLGK